MRFSFTGTLERPKSDKIPFIREGVTTTGKKQNYKRMSLSVASGSNNRAWVDMMGVENEGDEIKCRDTKGNNILIKWDDRFDSDIVADVSSLSKYVVAINADERKEFISQWDFIEYVEDHIDEISGGRYTVTGRVRRDIYKGRINNRFELQGIYPPKKDAKDRLRVTGEVYFTADDIDLSDWNTERKITISGYTRDYVDKDTGTKYLQQNLIFDASKINPENEKARIQTQLNASQFGVEINDNFKATLTLKKKGVYRNNFVCAYQNGAEVLEFDESMLTPLQKTRIAAGLNTLDDYRPKGQIVGERVVLLKVVNFDNTKEYDNGMVLDTMKLSEFADEIYQPELPTETAEEALEKGMNPPEEPEEKKTEDEGDLEDLFE